MAGARMLVTATLQFAGDMPIHRARRCNEEATHVVVPVFLKGFVAKRRVTSVITPHE